MDNTELIARAHENVPRDLADWANLAIELRDALEAVEPEQVADLHTLHSDAPELPYPEATYRLTQMWCSCGWRTGVVHVRGEADLETMRKWGADHVAEFAVPVVGADDREALALMYRRKAGPWVAVDTKGTEK